MTRRRQFFTRLLVPLLAVLFLAPDAVARSDYGKGDLVRFTGRVTDAQGAPLPEMTVILKLSRERFKLLRMQREKAPETLILTTETGPDGKFQIAWQWDGFHNVFELAAGLPVRRDGRDDFEIFARLEATDLVTASNPVTVSLVVEEVAYLRWLRRFFAGEASADETRIYREHGRPDRVDAGESRGVPTLSWWYFAAGKVYRFRDGKLDEVTEFEPIKPL